MQNKDVLYFISLKIKSLQNDRDVNLYMYRCIVLETHHLDQALGWDDFPKKEWQ